jgi:PAS domain S-box-containing protein
MAASAVERSPSHDRVALLVRVAIVALAYFVGAKLGLRLAFTNKSVTAVWPPTGIAVAALVLFGPRVWPGIAAGAFLANLTNQNTPFLTAFGITVGNTLAPMAGAALVRALGMRRALDRVPDVLALVFLGGLLAMLLSATGGTTTLAVAGRIGRGGYGSAWLTWWLGDALGVAIFAPVLLAFLTPGADLSSFRNRPREAVVMFAATIVVSIVVFGTTVALPYIVVPFAIWGALRFSQPGAAGVSLLISVIAIVQTVADRGPFTGQTQTTDLLSLQAFNATVALTALVLAAITRERHEAQEGLTRAAEQLEERVRLRTEQLATSEVRMREAQALANIGSWYWDVGANAVTWTDELYRIYGLEPQASPATFEGYVQRVHPDHRDQVVSAVQETLRSGESFDHEYRIVRPTGEERWVHARGEVVTSPAGGAVIGLRGYCHDVTDRKTAEDALRSALEIERETARRLRLLDDFKDSLLTAVSHELRTPLTVIIGLASTLRNDEVALTPDDMRDVIERLEANAFRLEALLMDLLDVDRLNRRVIEPRPRATSLQDSVLRVLELIEFPNRSVSCELGSTVVSVDPAHLERIVENLVSNALKHTPAGTPVWITAQQTAEGVVLLVEDAGPGVPPELAEDIFEPFRRGETNSHAPGIGVGLSLVARFAALNGGRAWVEPREGGGASFHVLLPDGS